MRFPNLISALLMVFAETAMGATSPDCVTDKYQRYTEAQRTWQQGLTQLVVDVAPGSEDLAQRYLEDQLRLIELRELEMAYFAHVAPAKLRMQQPLNSWLSLSKTDRQQVASESERYAQLRDQARAARSRPAHPSGENLREIMKNEIITSSEYKDLLQEFLEATKAAEAIKC